MGRDQRAQATTEATALRVFLAHSLLISVLVRAAAAISRAASR